MCTDFGPVFQKKYHDKASSSNFRVVLFLMFLIIGFIFQSHCKTNGNLTVSVGSQFAAGP